MPTESCTICPNNFKEKEPGVVTSMLSNLKRFDDTKCVIGIRISKNNRQRNGQKEKHKRMKNAMQSIHIKLKIDQDEPAVNSGAPEETQFLLH